MKQKERIYHEGQLSKHGLTKQMHMTQHFSKTMSKLTVMKDDLKGLVDDLHVQSEHAKISEDIPDKYAEMQEQLANKLAQFIDDEETSES
jgi:hypothetical protein